MEKTNRFNFSNTPLSREEFLKKYGVNGKEQLLSIPIEVGKDEAEQLVFMNINRTIELLIKLLNYNPWAVNGNITSLEVKMKKIKTLLATSIFISSILFFILAKRRNH